MTYEKSCGAVLFTRINKEIKYVLVQQLEGFYSFPKGHIENNESEKETALREIYEELQIKATILDDFVITDEHSIPNKTNVIKQITYFLAEYQNQEIVYQKEELLSALLVSYEEAMNMFQYDSSKKILTEANDFILAKNIR